MTVATAVEQETIKIPVEQKTVKNREITVEPDWCPGCGDFGVLKQLHGSTTKKGVLEPHEICVVSGIGCSSNLPGFMYAYGVHSLHGRSLPMATGVKFANHHLKVIVTGGDGDGFGIGCGHWIHSMRRNLDLTYIVMDNEVYGLTTGQASPTTLEGTKTKTTPRGSVEKPINPISQALVSGATFIARAYTGEPAHMASIMEQAIAHKGFAFIDCFSPCVTYNKINTYAWFKERLYKIEDKEPDYDRGDFGKAMEKALEFSEPYEKISIGVIYQSERPTYEDTEPVFKDGPLVDQSLGLSAETFDSLLVETM